MVEIILGLGSNQGESLETCRNAVRELALEEGIAVVRTSSWYRSEPVGPIVQDWFVNGVAVARVSLGARELLGVLHHIEKRFGRVRREHWGPRTLDLDLLAYGDAILNLPDLTVPHPRMHERLFVLVPLQEVAPEWVHPVLHKTAAQLLGTLGRQDRIERIERVGTGVMQVPSGPGQPNGQGRPADSAADTQRHG
jgi:2-amino-4-hydroxy-6-hydroxymethyldihydropteridine diphosphokinase